MKKNDINIDLKLLLYINSNINIKNNNVKFTRTITPRHQK